MRYVIVFVLISSEKRRKFRVIFSCFNSQFENWAKLICAQYTHMSDGEDEQNLIKKNHNTICRQRLIYLFVHTKSAPLSLSLCQFLLFFIFL